MSRRREPPDWRRGKSFHRHAHLDLTLPTAAENLALDEALLEEAEAGPPTAETLRFWQSPRPIVVVGRSSKLDAKSAARSAGNWISPCCGASAAGRRSWQGRVA